MIYTSFGNLPEWASNAREFWRAANLYERANGAVYREHEIALPNELTREQLIDLAERLVKELVGAKPYQFAIHAREGRIEGIWNPHLHLMFSDRIPDGINRSPEQTFLRFNRNHPEAGGRRKDSGGKSPQDLGKEVAATREIAADILNQVLAEHDFDSRVDHRSLRDQGINRVPERHLGPARVRGLTVEAKARLAALRGSVGRLASC